MDADTLDDADLIENCITPDITDETPAKPRARAVDGAILVDWPQPGKPEPGQAIDPATLGWFKAHNPDWRAQIDEILRGWISAQTQGWALTPETGTTDERTPG